MAVLAPDEFSAQFNASFAHSAFRLEQLDYYVAPNETEPYERFLSGQAPDAAWREPWKRFVRNARSTGRQMSRVHILTEPLTDYAMFELTCSYPANVDAGEDVLILPRSRAGGLDLPEQDFWLFDSARAAVMSYDDAGNWLDVRIVDDRPTVGLYCRARDMALARATPLHDFLEQIDHRTKEKHERRAS
jgi:hypothetical protein